ncbi:hypothetical protein O1L60_00140 [Streptomyces diastatochromogenes]|nr:hypothetical protein [Streptomyces diastatochromogenes]
MPALEGVVRQAMCLPSLAPKYERPRGRGRLTLDDLPVLTRSELETATAEALALGLGGGTLWAHGGTLEAPGLSLLPQEMFAAQIRDDWNPLGPTDVVANLHPAGRMQPDHYFVNRFAAASGAMVLPVGRLPEDPDDDWLAFFARHHVTAVAAPRRPWSGCWGRAPRAGPCPGCAPCCWAARSTTRPRTACSPPASPTPTCGACTARRRRG